MIDGLLKKIGELLGKTGGVAGDVPEIEIADMDSALTISDAEIKNIYPSTFVAAEDNRSALTENDLFSFIKPIHDSLSSKKKDYDKLCDIAPEIKNATSILIPSILSPNSLKPISELTITIPYEGITEELRTKIIKVLSYHFNNELKLHEKLSGWIETALIKEGSKPLMIIPAHVIKKLRDRSLNAANESLDTSILKLSANRIYTRKSKLNNLDYSIECINGIDYNYLSEDISEDVKGMIVSSLKETEQQPDLLYKDNIIKISTESIKNVVTESKASEYISVIDNLEVLVFKNQNKKKTMKSINNEFDAFYGGDAITKETYKEEPLVDVSSLLSASAEDGDLYPLIEELPSESVIPITTKANPEDHLAYFIILDENGCPINADDYDDSLYQEEGAISVNNLYQTMKGGANISGLIPNNAKIIQSSFGSSIKRRTVSKIIDAYIDVTIRKNLEDMGIVGFDVKLNGTIMSTMFKRLLKRKRTNILFVPKSVMFYLAFDYNSDGTGRSKLENIKFPLSLKMTFMITKIMSLIESSTNKKRVEVQLEENKGINHLETLRAIKNRFVQSKLGGLSYDPSTIMKSIVERQVSVIPKGMPGISSFEIRDEVAPKSLPKPEAELFEEINNMFILGLDVPPSTLNQLGENEFSRSIATFNFFFSNKIMKYQGEICNEISGMLSCYTKYSTVLRNSIISILKDENTKIENKKGDPHPEKLPDDNTSDKKEKADSETVKILDRIISSIRMTLSSPKIVYDKAQYEEIKNYSEIINGLVDSLYPEEMVEDADLTDTFKVFKTFLKADLMSKYLNDISAFSQFNIEGLADVDFLKINNTKMSMANLNKMLKDIKSKIMEVTPAIGGDDSGSGGEESEWQ